MEARNRRISLLVMTEILVGKVAAIVSFALSQGNLNNFGTTGLTPSCSFA